MIEAPQKATLKYLFSFCASFFISLTRPYWRCYYSNTDAIIYVVDSSDRDRMSISKSELVAMLEVRAFAFLISITEIHLKMVKAICIYTGLKKKIGYIFFFNCN